MIVLLVRKRASGLTELLARELRDCGREVVVEHLPPATARTSPYGWAGSSSARTRPGDDHGTETIAVALVHPDAGHAAGYLHGRQLGYTDRGRLRCETTAILGAWQPAYAMLTHAAANLPLPNDLGMAPAHYGVHVEARRTDGTGHTLLRLGPYTQTWLASRDADRLNTEPAGHAARVVPGFTVTATTAPFDFGSRAYYSDPYGTDIAVVMAAALTGART